MAFQKWGEGGFNYHVRIGDMDFDRVEAAFFNSGLGVFAGAVQHPTPVETVSGAAKIVYIAGQLARDIDGNCVG